MTASKPPTLLAQSETILLGVPPCSGIQVSVKRLLQLAPPEQVRKAIQEHCASHISTHVRYHAQRVLYSLPPTRPLAPLSDPSDPECLRAALGDKDPERRLLAVRALGKIPKEKAGAVSYTHLTLPTTHSV